MSLEKASSKSLKGVDEVLKLDGLVIEWLGHAGFKIKGERIVYIDPYGSNAVEKADIILVTHSHYDHCSIADIQRLSTPKTIVVGPPSCQSKVSLEKVGINNFKIIKPGAKLDVFGVIIEAVPSYNIGKSFHPKMDENVGYVIGMGGKRIYHAGDTDKIPEMANLKNIDVAMLPIGGTYTMNAKEAAEAANLIKPKIALPMHYGKIVGTNKDAESFKKMCKVSVEIL